MAVSLRASRQGLEIVEQKRRKKGWTATATAWCDAAKTSVATLKRFRRRLPIQQDAFIAICEAVGENWEAIVDNTPVLQTDSRPEFFAYNDTWVGREQLVAELKDKVQGACRVLIVTGITGIGKTALAERLAIELQEDWLEGDWKKFIPENLDNQEKTSDFAHVAVRWLEKCGQSTPVPDTSEDPKKREELRRQWVEQLLYRLVKRLQENRYLVLIDSLELILEGNQEEGWSDFEDEWWVRFFQNLLSVENCQTRVIITSQDLPAQIATIGARYQNFWCCQPLSGLAEAEQLVMFQKTGLEVDKELPSQQYLVRIGNAYEGHPLALQVIAREIGSQPFYGNVVAYWNKYGHEVEKTIEESKTREASADEQWQLHRYSRNLRRKVQSRLEKTISRLKKDFYYAYVLLCEVSIYRYPVQEDFWLNHLEDWNCDEDQKTIALDVLHDRCLIEEVVDKDQCLLRQHNLIRSVAHERLKQLGEDNE